MKTENPDRLLRLPEVLERVPVSKSTLWSWVKSNKFPKPIKLGPRTTCWKESEIDLVVRGEFYTQNRSLKG